MKQTQKHIKYFKKFRDTGYHLLNLVRVVNSTDSEDIHLKSSKCHQNYPKLFVIKVL